VSSKQIREKSPNSFNNRNKAQKDKISIFNLGRSKSPRKDAFMDFQKDNKLKKFQNTNRVKSPRSKMNLGQPQFPIKDKLKGRITPNRKGSKGFFKKLNTKDSSKKNNNIFDFGEKKRSPSKKNLYEAETDKGSIQNMRTSLTGNFRSRFADKNKLKESPMRKGLSGNSINRTHSMTRANIKKNSRMMSREKRLERYSRRTEKRSQSPGGGIKLKFGEMRKSKANMNFGQLTNRSNKMNKSVEIDKKESQKRNLNQTMNMKVGENQKKQNNNIFGDFIGIQSQGRGKKSNLTGLGKTTIIKKGAKDEEQSMGDERHSFDTNSDSQDIQESEVS
jgi:hypothetical protein